MPAEQDIERLPIKFPFAGVKRDGAFSALGESETHNALNARPFDQISSRLRGGQRPGSSKFLSSQVNGSSPIQLMALGTQALDPLSVVADTTILDVDLTASTLGRLTTVESSGFDTDRSSPTSGSQSYNPNYTAGDATTSAYIRDLGGTLGQVLAPNDTSANNRRVACWFNSALSLGTVHVVTYKVRYIARQSVSAENPMLIFRVDGAAPAGSTYIGIAIRRTQSDGLSAAATYTCQIASAFTTGTYAAGVLQTTAAFAVDEGSGVVSAAGGDTGAEQYTDVMTVAVEVNGNNFIVKVNGNQVMSQSTALYSGKTRAGLCVKRTNVNGRYDVVGTHITVATGDSPVSLSTTKLLAISGGSIYLGTSSGLTKAAGGTMKTGGRVDGEEAFQNIYLCDGLSANYQYVRLAEGDTKDWATDVTAGTLPQGSLDTTLGCSVIAVYRGRVVMAGLSEDPRNWFMSRSGDPFDWDYSPATTDALQAVAGNNANAGKIGDVITSLIPFQDDLMFIGGDHTIWVMSGDPAAGGIIDNVSRQVGITGPRAWAWDVSSQLYFMGVNGLYRMGRDGMPELVSKGKMDSVFSAIDYTTYEAVLSYDTNLHGVHIFLVPISEASSAGTHYFYDERTNSFWIDAFPSAIGPSESIIYDSADPDDRTILLGGFDGYIRQTDIAAKDDDGTAIESWVDFSPISFGVGLKVLYSQFQCQLDMASDDAYFKVYSGETVQDAMTNSNLRLHRTVSAGANKRFWQRIRDNAIRIRLGNDTVAESWALEQAACRIEGAGRQLTTDKAGG